MSFARYPSLADRTVLVTGGGSGIGADIVRAFAENGAKVAFLDILEAESRALVASLADARHVPLFLACDLTDIPALKAAIAAAAERLGPITVLVNNAANDDRHAVDAVTEEYWDRCQDVNLKHQFFACQAVHPMMKAAGGGSIINLSSIAWRLGAGEMPAYGVAKAGVTGLTIALARAFGPDGIRVNAIEPGAVITERQKRLWFQTQDKIDTVVQRQLIRRVLLGDEIARTALFLASDDSRMITKQSITVDAGLK